MNRASLTGPSGLPSAARADLVVAGCAVLMTLAGPLSLYVSYYAPVLVILAFVAVIGTTIGAITAALRRRWRQATIYLVPVLAMLAVFPDGAPRHLLIAAGIQSRILLTGTILDPPVTIVFAENGAREEVRFHGTLNRMIGDDDYHYILYDTTGEIARAPALRSEVWRQSMARLPEGSLIASSAFPATRLYQAYYDVRFTPADTGG